MKLIPPVPSPLTKSSGERILFDILGKTDLPGWTAYHSLSVSKHEYKRWGELDFVLISPEGVLALEVKGGRVGVSDGEWTFTDRWDEEHRRQESPFKQAETGVMGLRSSLEDKLRPDHFDTIPFGYGVVFPQTDFAVASVEWAPDTILDRARMRSPEAVTAWLKKLVRYWQQKTRRSGPLPPDLVREVKELIRPSFDRAPSLRYRVEDAVLLMDRLTEEQYRQLDFVEESPRLVCEGGAGTGKTFLAAELARRWAARGQRVLFTCWSPVLAAYLRTRLPAGVVVIAWDDIPGPHGMKFDALIVDEAQDVLSIEALQRLDPLVTGGLESGRWAVFLDPNTQSAVRGAMEPDALELLRVYGGTPGRLKWNCRNTQPIVIQTRAMTGADLGNPSAGQGPAVEFAKYDTSADCGASLERHLDRLLRGGISPSEITILSPKPMTESSVQQLAAGMRDMIHEVTTGSAGSFPPPTISFAMIEDFKGLENNYVAVIDIDRFAETERDIALVYVAMSRARAGLWLAYHRELDPEIAAAGARNLASAIPGDGASNE